jgi:hypothetical protein
MHQPETPPSLCGIANNSPPQYGVTECRLIASPVDLADADLETWLRGGFTGSGFSFVRLQFILQELRWLDDLTRRAALLEAWFKAMICNGLIVVRVARPTTLVRVCTHTRSRAPPHTGTCTPADH